MRFMVMVKATKDSEAGVLPSEELLAEMGKYNEELVKAGVMLAGEGLQPSSKGARVQFSGDKRTVIDGPFAETKELVAGFWIWQVQVEGGGDRVGQALPEPDAGRDARSRSARCSRPRTSAPSSRPSCESRKSGSAAAQDRGAAAVASSPCVADDLHAMARSGDSRVTRQHASRDRRGLADRVAPSSSPGSRAWCATSGSPRSWRRTRSSPRSSSGRTTGVPDNPGRVADGDREAPRDRSAAPRSKLLERKHEELGRELEAQQERQRRTSTPRSTTTSATTCCASSSSPVIRCSRPRRASRSRCACSAA